MRRNTSFLSLLIPLTLLLSACASAGPAVDDGRLNVVATIGHLGDVVANVGGAHVRVTSLMGPGIDPHLYVATEGDVSRLADADVIFYSGLHLEAAMAEVLEQVGQTRTTVAVGESIPEDQLISGFANTEYPDPHTWFNVQLWFYVVEVVRDTLIEVDPANAAAYEANAAAYLDELQALDAYVQEQVARVPEDQRVLITAHDAFNYFGQRYGFEVLGLQGISTASEAGTADVQQLSDFIVENQIHAIFVESSVPVRNVEALQEAVAAKGFTVEIGGELFSDAMGNAGTFEGTYIGMVTHNVDTIVNALLNESE